MRRKQIKTPNMDLLSVIFGMIIGGIIAFISAKVIFSKTDSVPQGVFIKAQNDIASLNKETELLGISIAETDKQLKSERESKFSLSSELSKEINENKNLQLRLTEQKEQLESLEKRFQTEFENLANRILEEKSLKFTEQNKTNIDQILKPLSDRIKGFEDKVDKVYSEDLKDRATLLSQIKTLQDLNQRVSDEANNLTKALKGESKTQGNWGEFILESILEKTGLVKDREFVVQESITNEDGKRYQPDVIIKLPDDRNIIVDSKVSLKDYEVFCSTDNDEERKRALASHISSVRNHIKGLSLKKYQDLYGIQSLDFVIMFMPIEPALSITAQGDINIWNDAFENNIVIVSPSTLLATLRTIANIWKQEYRTRNVLDIAKQSSLLYDKFVGMYSDLLEVERKFDAARESLDSSMKKIKTGRGNLISQVEKIKHLGITTAKSLPADLTAEAFEEDETDESVT
ncbi:MAG: DNA recombination protein RmuC [Ignavibacteriae bacterium]|nr:DNA recombination protein RmuC [Ignavibacteriota bacterium]